MRRAKKNNSDKRLARRLEKEAMAESVNVKNTTGKAIDPDDILYVIKAEESEDCPDGWVIVCVDDGKPNQREGE